MLDIPLENKVPLFDAENQLWVELDQKERSLRRIKDVDGEIKRMGKLISLARGGLSGAKRKKNAEQANIAKMAIDNYKLKADYLKERKKLLQVRAVYFDKKYNVARAEFELEKALIIKSYKPNQSKRIKVASFEKQLEKFEKIERKYLETIGQQDQKTKAAKGRWLRSKDELYRVSDGSAGNPWLEDIIAWGVDPWEDDS